MDHSKLTMSRITSIFRPEGHRGKGNKKIRLAPSSSALETQIRKQTPVEMALNKLRKSIDIPKDNSGTINNILQTMADYDRLTIVNAKVLGKVIMFIYNSELWKPGSGSVDLEPNLFSLDNLAPYIDQLMPTKKEIDELIPPSSNYETEVEIIRLKIANEIYRYSIAVLTHIDALP